MAVGNSEKPYKYINLSLEDGRVYRIDAHKVAQDRASHYGKSDKYPSFEDGYKEEYDYTITSPDELGEWLMNNMDWYELDPQYSGRTEHDLSDAQVTEKNYYHE